MAQWLVTVEWDVEVEADDEGDALMEADRQFSFARVAEAVELDPDND